MVDKEGKDVWYYLAGVKVSYADERYSVVSYMELSDVKPDRREALLSFANELRVQNGLRAGREDSGWLVLKRVLGLPAARAIDEASEQLLALKNGLDRIR